jgi:predicted unusual protein kinase regulating ubiquinone biosynthesis (AarF/ABC1/UbiB family)
MNNMTLTKTNRYNIKTQLTQTVDSSKKLAKILKFAGRLQYMRVVKKASYEELGAFTRDNLAELGSTFIKIGQLLSTRSDLLDKRFTTQLLSLQDNVPPFDISMYRQEVGRITTSFEDNPIASASIGQVHKGILKTGESVAIKLKRPNIAIDIDTDFTMLLGFIAVLRKIQDRRELYELETVFKQYETLLNEEIDFTREVQNIQTFQNMFSTSGDLKFIKVPTPYPNVSSNDVIVMEYLPAIKISDVTTLDRLKFNKQLIAEKLVECYIKQIVEYGKVHIDPHPGNVGMTTNGKIVFYDYGMVFNINPVLMSKFQELLIAVSEKDAGRIAELMVEGDIVTVEPENFIYLRSFVLSFLNYIENVNVTYIKENFIDKIGSKDLPFLVNSNFLLILRGLTILEGVCKTLDPDFSYKKVIDPYINQQIPIDITYLEKRALKDIQAIQKLSIGQVITDTQKSDIDKELLEKKVKDMSEAREREQSRQTMSNLVLVAMLVVFGWGESVIDNVFLQTGMVMITFLSLYSK